MSGYVFEDLDSIEPIADTLGEMWGTQALYNVISGVSLAYDAANLTVDLAAGAIMHYGVPLQIAALANAFTLVADPTNPRWTWLCLSSAGAAVVVSGTAAATPSVPELGDRVALALVYVQAGLTIAENATYKLDKRIANPQGLVGYSGTATSTTSTAVVPLVVISKLGFSDSIPVTQNIRVEVQWRKQALAAQSVGFGFIINATTVLTATAGTVPCSTAVQQAEDGWFTFWASPRSTANYSWWDGYGSSRVTATGAKAQPSIFIPATPAAVWPNAATTSITITAINGTTNNAAEIDAVFVYAE